MKRFSRLLLISGFCILSLAACGKKDEVEVEEVVDTTEQVAFDDVEVEDYTVLSYSELEVLAYQGDTEAQVNLGRMLEYGTEDVKQNFTEAISWYQMASDSGNIDGTDALGYFYLTGAGVDQDLEKAEELFRLAIEGGSVNAKVGLARVMLIKGDYEALAAEALMSEELEEESPDSQKSDNNSKENDKKNKSSDEDSESEGCGFEAVTASNHLGEPRVVQIVEPEVGGDRQAVSPKAIELVVLREQ